MFAFVCSILAAIWSTTWWSLLPSWVKCCLIALQAACCLPGRSWNEVAFPAAVRILTTMAVSPALLFLEPARVGVSVQTWFFNIMLWIAKAFCISSRSEKGKAWRETHLSVILQRCNQICAGKVGCRQAFYRLPVCYAGRRIQFQEPLVYLFSLNIIYDASHCSLWRGNLIKAR